MKNYLIAERYARGLAGTIQEDAQMVQATQSLADLFELYEQNHDLNNVLSNPAIRLESRLEILQDALTRANIDKSVGQLAKLLLRRGRFAILSDVHHVFVMLADERLNQIQATVTTATPATPTQQEAIATALQKHSGKDVRMKCTVDPTILGGVVARIGSTVIDGSVRTKLTQLKNALLTEER
jgi:F-type H+-transporting ATPase subunit delta